MLSIFESLPFRISYSFNFINEAMARTIAPQTNVIEVTPLLKDVPEALQNTGAIDGDPDEDDMQLCT
ncbi:hypothetical protein R6Q59_029801 [Mikania micrantha]